MQGDPRAGTSLSPRPRIRLGAGLLKAFLILLLWLAAYALYELSQNNFHTVVPGKVYRSGRMNSATLTNTMQQYGIHSVLSLIGSSLSESNAIRQMGGTYFDIPLSDLHPVTGAQMEQLVVVLRTAPKPMLIHCRAGADRTGLAAALYHFAIEEQPAQKADDELTVFYGHMPSWLKLSTSAMDTSFWAYVREHSQSGPTNRP